MHYKTIFVGQKVIAKRDTLNWETSVYYEYITIRCDISERVLNVDGKTSVLSSLLHPYEVS